MLVVDLVLGRTRKRPDLKQRMFDVATCMGRERLDPYTKKLVNVAKNLHDRKFRRALRQFFELSNDFEAIGDLPCPTASRPC